MKDVRLDTEFKRFLHALAVIMFIPFGFFLPWLIALFLYTYGRNTNYNTEKIPNVLNMSYQKWIYVMGLIYSVFFIFIVAVLLLRLSGVI